MIHQPGEPICAIVTCSQAIAQMEHHAEAHLRYRKIERHGGRVFRLGVASVLAGVILRLVIGSESWAPFLVGLVLHLVGFVTAAAAGTRAMGHQAAGDRLVVAGVALLRATVERGPPADPAVAFHVVELAMVYEALGATLAARQARARGENVAPPA